MHTAISEKGPACGCRALAGSTVARQRGSNGRSRGVAPAGRRLRQHRYYARTVSVCPQCRRVIGAKIVEKLGKAYLDKHCPEHGRFFNLVSSSFDDYASPGALMIQGQMPRELATRTVDGCPQDCGFCPQHEQHACIGLIEITGRCNMRCPICYADSGSWGDVTPADFARRLDTLQRAEGRIDVVQISGGEPTLHPRLVELLREAARRKPSGILLNTNGRLIANDRELVRKLAEFKDLLDVYLQYDGPSAAASKTLRGADLREEKERALGNLALFGLKTILVTTVCRENLEDLPAIVELAARTRCVTGVTFQALSFCGRNRGNSSAQRVTTPDIIASLTAPRWLKRSDVFPLPCSHPYCTQISYLYCRPGRPPFPLTRLFRLEEAVDLIRNRLSHDPAAYGKLRKRIGRLSFRGGFRLSNVRAAWGLGRFLRNAKRTRWQEEKLLRIVIKQFMDAETFDAGRATRCCIAVVTGDGRMVPFCSYNTIHRDRERVSRD